VQSAVAGEGDDEDEDEAGLLAARGAAHPALRGAIRSGRKELRAAELGVRAAKQQALQLVRRVASFGGRFLLLLLFD
jgi:hypothetical protein